MKSDHINVSHIDVDFSNFIEALENWSKMPDIPIDWKKAKVGNGDVSDGRSNSVIDLMPVLENETFSGHPVSVEFKRLHVLIDEIVTEYKERFGIPLRFDNGWAVNRYEISQEYVPHYDWAPLEDRVVSVVVMANTPTSGGELIFPDHDLTVPAAAGTVVVFPSSFPYRHASMPVKEGTKYSIVSWLG